MNPEEIYLHELPTIERIAARVARHNHVASGEVEEFVQEACVRILDKDYAIIRKFKNGSKLSTYLTTVIGHLCSQWRVEQWGKWRPSAEAKRLGPTAVKLERLLTRDGLSWPEAVAELTTPSSSKHTIRELEAIYLRLPVRTPRPKIVSEEVLPDVPVEPDAHERIEAGDRVRTLSRAMGIIDDVASRMSAEDRLILQMRFQHARRVPDIARLLDFDQKKLYKRLDRLFAELRGPLERAGVSKADVALLLHTGDEGIHLNLFSEGENGPPGPSHDAGGDKVGSGQGRKK